MLTNIGSNVSGKQVACRFAPGKAITRFGTRTWVTCMDEQTAETVFFHRLFAAWKNSLKTQIAKIEQVLN